MASYTLISSLLVNTNDSSGEVQNFVGVHPTYAEGKEGTLLLHNKLFHSCVKRAYGRGSLIQN